MKMDENSELHLNGRFDEQVETLKTKDEQWDENAEFIIIKKKPKSNLRETEEEMDKMKYASRD